MSKTIRLDRLLANLGYGSRKYVGQMVRRGQFTIDGKPVTDASAQISFEDIKNKTVLIGGEPLDPLPPLTIMLNKPVGYVSSHSDPGGGPDVFELLPHRFRIRKPVLGIAGRLDMDTSGLMILTDDGQLLHRIISPKAETRKVYRAWLERPLQGDEAALFASGTLMLKSEKKPLLPAELKVIDQTTVELTLQEGRYHQVRRMFAATGNHVKALQRLSVGPLTLNGLEEGDWRALSEDEIDAL